MFWKVCYTKFPANFISAYQSLKAVKPNEFYYSTKTIILYSQNYNWLITIHTYLKCIIIKEICTIIHKVYTSQNLLCSFIIISAPKQSLISFQSMETNLHYRSICKLNQRVYFGNYFMVHVIMMKYFIHVASCIKS